MSAALNALDSYPATPQKSGVFYDFMSDEDLAAFVYTQISGGTAAVIDTNDDSANGVLLMSSVDTTEDKGAQIQLDAEVFQFRANKALRIVQRFRVSAAEQSDCLFGLAITDTSLIASAPSNGAFFQSLDADATLKFRMYAGSSLVLDLGVAELEDDTWINVAADFSSITAGGAGHLNIYVNGNQVVSATVADIPLTEALALSAAFQSGAAAIQTGSLDYIGCDQDR